MALEDPRGPTRSCTLELVLIIDQSILSIDQPWRTIRNVSSTICTCPPRVETPFELGSAS
jgi:hypothetical protein